MKKKRKRIPESVWADIRTAHASSGTPLRQLAERMKVPTGTLLGRAAREKWTRKIREARALVPVDSMPAVSPMQAVIASMQERGERHVGRVAGLTEKMVGTFEKLPEADQLQFVAELERLDKIGRKAFGIADPSDGAPFVAVSVLNQW